MTTRFTEADCQAYRDAASDYLDGYIGDEELAVVERHIAHCSSCVAFTEELKVMLRVLDGVREEEPVASLAVDDGGDIELDPFTRDDAVEVVDCSAANAGYRGPGNRRLAPVRIGEIDSSAVTAAVFGSAVELLCPQTDRSLSG